MLDFFSLRVLTILLAFRVNLQKPALETELKVFKSYSKLSVSV